MRKKAIIFGAGLSGLTLAWKLAESGEYNVLLLEKSDKPGGVSSTFEKDGYLLDYGPHKIYPQFPEVYREIKDLLGEDMLTIPKKSSIYLLGKFFDYPFKAAELILGINPFISARLMLSYFGSVFKKKKEEGETYEEYISNRFGKALYRLIFESQASKIWGDPKILSGDLAKTRLPFPSLKEVIIRMLFGYKGKKEISAEEFYYPKNGMIELSRKIAERITAAGGRIEYNSRPKEIKLEEAKAEVAYETAGGELVETFDLAASTIPLPELAGLIGHEVPQPILEAAKKLKYRAVVLVYAVVKKNKLTDDDWIFFAEKEFIFNRVFEQKAFSRFMIPEGVTVACADFTADEDDEAWNLSEDELGRRVVEELHTAGLVDPSEVSDYFVVKLPFVYPVYDMEYSKNLDAVMGYLDGFPQLISFGRLGLFNYSNMDHCLDMGITIARNLLSAEPKPYREIRERFKEYRIVD